jgi:hypothetical protein
LLQVASFGCCSDVVSFLADERTVCAIDLRIVV